MRPKPCCVRCLNGPASEIRGIRKTIGQELARNLFLERCGGAARRPIPLTMARKILIIDDSAMLRRIAANILGAQPSRYEVFAATRATEGFARACAGDVDLVLTDYRLAGLPEASFCQRMMAESRTAGIPVVLLLGRDVQPPSLESLPANIVEVLRKPFAPEQLTGLVNTVFDLLKSGLGLPDLRVKLHPASTEDTKQTSIRTAVAEGSTGWPAVARNEPLTDQQIPSFSDRNLAATSLRTAMHHWTRHGECGVLRISRPEAGATEVFLENGRIVVVGTYDGEAYAQDAMMVLPTKISPATLEAAIVEQCQTGIPLFLTLGTRGVLSKAVAVRLVHTFGQKHFAQLWRWRPHPLCIEFERCEALPGFALRLESSADSVDAWLLDSARRLQPEDVAAQAIHEGKVGIPVFQPEGKTILKSLRLTEDESAFTDAVNGKNDLPNVAARLGISLDTAFLYLKRFRCLEVMDYRPSPTPFVITPVTSMRRVLPLKR